MRSYFFAKRIKGFVTKRTKQTDIKGRKVSFLNASENTFKPSCHIQFIRTFTAMHYVFEKPTLITTKRVCSLKMHKM